MLLWQAGLKKAAVLLARHLEAEESGAGVGDDDILKAVENGAVGGEAQALSAGESGAGIGDAGGGDPDPLKAKESGAGGGDTDPLKADACPWRHRAAACPCVGIPEDALSLWCHGCLRGYQYLAYFVAQHTRCA